MGGWGGGVPSAPAAHPPAPLLQPPLQVSKMLGDAAFPQFYPTVFVLVTEMLEHDPLERPTAQDVELLLLRGELLPTSSGCATIV
mgnify:CR=1 FL=1